MKKLMLDRSVKFGDVIIKEDQFGGALVAVVRRTTAKQWMTRISRPYAERHGLSQEVIFLADELDELLALVEQFVNAEG